MRLGIANGRVRVRYGYACYGYTRGNGTVWHGGIDLELLDGTTFYMPTYKGNGDAMAIYNLAKSLGLVEQGLYGASYV